MDKTMTDIGSFIVQSSDIQAGRPHIAGTGVTVHRIVVWHKLGFNPEEIADRIGDLTVAQVYAALAHYHANREQIEADLASDEVALLEQAPCYVTGDTMVVTPSGLRPIGELQVGDEVLTHLGRYRPVSRLRQEAYSGKMVTLTRARCNIPIQVTPDQPVLAVRGEMCPYREGRRCLPVALCAFHRMRWPCHLDCPRFKDDYSPAWIAAGNLRRPSDYVYFPPTHVKAPASLAIEPRPYPNAKPIPATVDVTPDLMAWFGYFVSDGHSNPGGPKFVHDKDVDHILALGETLFGLQGRLTPLPAGTKMIMFDSRSFGRWMFSLLGDGVANKRLPEWVFGVDDECRRALLRALLRTGSYISKSPTNEEVRAFHFATASLTLAHQVMRLLLKEGIPCGLNVYRPEVIHGKDRLIHLNYPNHRVDVHHAASLDRFIDLSRDLAPSPEDKPPKTQHNYPFAESWLYAIRQMKWDQTTATVYSLDVAEDHSYVTTAFALRSA